MMIPPNHSLPHTKLLSQLESALDNVGLEPRAVKHMVLYESTSLFLFGRVKVHERIQSVLNQILLDMFLSVSSLEYRLRSKDHIQSGSLGCHV